MATEYGIRSIPTVMVFKNGQKMDAVIGAVPKNTLVQVGLAEPPAAAFWGPCAAGLWHST